MHDTITNLFIALGGALSVAVGTMFGVPPDFLLPAALGSTFGVAFSGSVSKFYGALLVIFGAIATGYAMPLLQAKWPDVPGKTLAFLFTLLLLGFRVQIYEGGKIIINAGISGAAARLRQLLAPKEPGGEA